ncbi:MAG: molybdenum transport ATP-binding protein ModC [Nocardioidaceae bacterium]|nr:molybdenum transport ATP-binding protein ModC [Nocardioidaceae bacterium]
MTRPGPLDAHLVTAPPRGTGAFTLDVRLAAGVGEVVAVLGPNGAGKSTALRMLAGLHPLSAGHVRLGGRSLEEPGRSIRVPAQRRGVGLVPQESLLFPHLRVRDQVAFGLRHRGADRAEARRESTGWLERTGLGELADRRPSELSGGQARRVAIVRALAARPALLLLDEPLAALDVRAVLELRSFLRHHLAHVGVPTVLVTHDALDALVLADVVVVLDAGRVEQAGRPAEVAGRPRSAHVAALVGLNLVRGTSAGHLVTMTSGTDGTGGTGEPAQVVTATEQHGDVFCCWAPGAVSVHGQRPEGSPRNVWRGEITGMTPHGDIVRLEVAGPVSLLADVTPAAVAELDLAPAAPVWVSVKATEVTVYPA